MSFALWGGMGGREDDPHEGAGVDVELPDHGVVGVLGEIHRPDPVGHVEGGIGKVDVGVEFDENEGNAFQGGAFKAPDPLDLADGVFQGFRHQGFHVLGTRPGVGGPYGHEGNLDLREEGYTHASHA